MATSWRQTSSSGPERRQGIQGRVEGMGHIKHAVVIHIISCKYLKVAKCVKMSAKVCIIIVLEYPPRQVSTNEAIMSMVGLRCFK